MAAGPASAVPPPAVLPPAPARATGRRLPLRAVVRAGVVVTLLRPATWVVALAGFLAGGGIVALAWPITVLPTLTGVQNLLGAPISTLAFGDPSPELVRAAAIGGAAAALLLAAGLIAGAWAERRGIALTLEGAADEGIGVRVRHVVQTGAPGTGSLALLRLLALLPPAAALVLSWPALYGVTYQELILPGDLATPLPLRVVAQVPLQLAAVVGAWLLADAAAAAGARRLVLERLRVPRAWALGWADLVRRPQRILPLAVLGDLVLAVAAGPALAVAAIAWGRVRASLELGPNSPVGIATVALWVAMWLGTVALAGVGAAIRDALLTLEGVEAA